MFICTFGKQINICGQVLLDLKGADDVGITSANRTHHTVVVEKRGCRRYGANQARCRPRS